jgi:hypothetical protein
MRYLSKQCGGNVADKGVVKVGASSTCSGAAKDVADIETTAHFYSLRGPNQWLGYDFQASRVVVKSYALRSHPDPVGGRHPRSWVVEAWAEGTDWTEIDRREEDPQLNAPEAIVVFEATKLVEARMIRIRQIGPNWQGNDELLFRAFELYGGLLIPT